MTGRLLEVACSSKEKEQRARKARDEGGSQDYGDVVDTMTKLSLGSALDGSEKSTTSSGIGTCFSSAKEQNIISQSYIYSRTSSMAGRWKWHLRPYSLVASIALIITCVLLPGSPRFFVAARQDDQDSVYMQSTTESSWASVVVTPDIKARFLVLADNATNATTADDTTSTTVDENHNTTMANSTESNSNNTNTSDFSGGENSSSTLSSTNNTATSTDDNATDTDTGVGDGNSTSEDLSNSTVTDGSSGGDASNSTANSNTTMSGVNTTNIYGCNVTSGEKWCESLQICFKEWQTICPTSASCASDDDCTLWGGGYEGGSLLPTNRLKVETFPSHLMQLE